VHPRKASLPSGQHAPNRLYVRAPPVTAVEGTWLTAVWALPGQSATNVAVTRAIRRDCGWGCMASPVGDKTPDL
jgi:hypothetical protein